MNVTKDFIQETKSVLQNYVDGNSDYRSTALSLLEQITVLDHVQPRDTSIDIYERLNSGVYEPKVKYPDHRVNTLQMAEAVRQVKSTFVGTLAQINAEIDRVTKEIQAEFKQQESLYYTSEAEAQGHFKIDLLASYGLTGHPKADKAYSLAWEDGHANGLSEVANCFSKYAELLED